MTTQPEALRLAEQLETEWGDDCELDKAAAELRRLYAFNQELLDALKALVQDSQHAEHDCGDRDCPVLKARAVIAKAEGRA